MKNFRKILLGIVLVLAFGSLLLIKSAQNRLAAEKMKTYRLTSEGQACLKSEYEVRRVVSIEGNYENFTGLDCKSFTRGEWVTVNKSGRYRGDRYEWEAVYESSGQKLILSSIKIVKNDSLFYQKSI